MYNNCTDKTGKVEIHHFFKSLVYCLEDEIPSHETTTEESYGYFGGFGGGMFDYGDDEVQKYPNVEELLKAIELDIEEILDSFSFGRHSFITPYMKKQDRKELFSMDWTTKLHYEDGFCHKYDPKVVVTKNVTVVDDDTLLSMEMQFDVIFY